MPDLNPKPKLTRRRILKRFAAATAGLGLTTFTYAWRVEPHWIEVVRRSLPITRLPKSLVGKTLVQISDLHVGPIVDEQYISAAMDRVSELRADIVTITGDFMTCRGTEQIDPVMHVLSRLRPGKLATIGILGNHDYAWRWASESAAEQLTRRLRLGGMTILRNERCEVDGLQILGIDDLWGTNFHPETVMPTLSTNDPSLVLCHNPDAMDLQVWSGYRGWILSGHTHGGQCKPPFFAPPVTPVTNKRYTAGEFDLHDGRKLYINRGLGYLHRVRFNARPEITVFTLESAHA